MTTEEPTILERAQWYHWPLIAALFAVMTLLEGLRILDVWCQRRILFLQFSSSAFCSR